MKSLRISCQLFLYHIRLGIAELKDEEQAQSVLYKIEPTYQMVAEEAAPYGETKN